MKVTFEVVVYPESSSLILDVYESYGVIGLFLSKDNHICNAAISEGKMIVHEFYARYGS